LSETIPKGKGKVFFIDDEESQLKSIQPVLERLGYTVRVETDSIKALAAFKKSPESFDLIITDQNMPKLTGDKFAEAVLSIRPDIPVILCTGFSEIIDAHRSKAIGVSAFLMKPFSIKEIAETIERVLKI
jgi:DNA-binding NtrC family response regulator